MIEMKLLPSWTTGESSVADFCRVTKMPVRLAIARALQLAIARALQLAIARALQLAIARASQLIPDACRRGLYGSCCGCPRGLLEEWWGIKGLLRDFLRVE